MLENFNGDRGTIIIKGGNTDCSCRFSDEGELFLTLNIESRHSTISLGTITGYIVDRTSDGLLYLRTSTGGEVVTFFDKFPKVLFGPFASDLLNDIGGIQRYVRDKVPNITEPTQPNPVEPKAPELV